MNDTDTPRSGREQLESQLLSALCATSLDPSEVHERFRHAQRSLRDDYFSEPYRSIWTCACTYYTLTGQRPSPEHFNEMLLRASKLSSRRRAQYSARYAELVTEEVSLAQFRFAVVRLVERWKGDRLAEALTTGARVLGANATIERPGRRKETLAGYDDAVRYLQEELADLDAARLDAQPEGNLNWEGAALLRDVYAAASQPAGVASGFGPLDQATGGLQPGELGLIAGYAAEGKSHVAYAWAYDACYRQRRNVLFATIEMSRRQVQRAMVAIHSHRFAARRPLRTDALKTGTLTPDEEALLRTVVADQRDGNYGQLYCFGLPHKSTEGDLFATYSRVAQQFHVDLVVVDYLGLMSSSQRRQTRREELDDLLQATKRFAIDADGGRGVAVLSPWQMSRTAWEQAQQTGGYTKASLSDTSQAEKSADLVVSLLRVADDQLDCRLLKNRDGRDNLDFTLRADFATAQISAGQAAYASLLRSV